MKKALALFICLAISFFVAEAQDMSKQEKIQSAMSAAPYSISENATIKDWPAGEGEEMAVLRAGNNQFTCLPDMPATPGNDPMCLDDPWLKWADAWMNKKDFTINKMGFGYMLQGGTPESNIDPYAEGPKPDNQWLEEAAPHLMIVVPNNGMLSGLPVTPEDGGPWVMWENTPYVHIMVPMPKYSPPMQQASN
jgi:hypothetical protein